MASADNVQDYQDSPKMAPEDIVGDFCLICYSNQSNDSEVICDFVERSSSSSLPTWPKSRPETLEKALDAYFILKHVLQLPSGKLEDFLRRSPNPEDWVKICGHCYGNFVGKCKRLFIELVEVQRKFEGARKELIAAIKKSVETSDCPFGEKNTRSRGRRRKYDSLTLNVTHEARRLIRDGAMSGSNYGKAELTATTGAIDEMVEEITSSERSKWSKENASIHVKEEYGSEEEEQQGEGMPLDQGLNEEDGESVIEAKEETIPDCSGDDSDNCQTSPSAGGHTSDVINNPDTDEAMGATDDEDEEVDEGSSGDADWSGGDLSAESSDDHGEDGDSDVVGNDAMSSSAGSAVLQPRRKRKAKPKGSHKPRRQLSERENDKLMKAYKFKCSLCSLECACAKSLKRHMKRKHGKILTTLPCPVCQKHVRPDYLRVHVTTVHASERLQCPKCPQTYKKSSGLSFHMRAVHRSGDQDIPILACSFPGCQKSYIQKSQLEYHEAYHKLPQFHCSICGKGLHSKRDLQRHELQHQNKITRPFICDQCPARYSNRVGLQLHTRQRHPTADGGNNLEESTPHPCPTCGKVSKSRELLERHIKRLHVNKHQVTCELCGKCVGSDSLRLHMKNIHESPIQFPCTKVGCRKSFRTEESMKRHVKTHNERTEFRCDHCDKLFKNATSLSGHLSRLRADKVARPFVCQTCGKGFTGASNLKQHAKVHQK